MKPKNIGFWITVRKAQGWKWEPVPHGDGKVFLPPEGHPLRNAATIHVVYKNERWVPHWIDRGGLLGERKPKQKAGS